MINDEEEAMSTFKRIETSHGRTQYWRDGKLVSKNDIPSSVIQRLQEVESGEEVQEEMPEAISIDEIKSTKSNPNPCIFTGQPATHTRYVNGQSVGLSEHAYYNYTVGEIAARINEIEKNRELPDKV